MKAVKIIATDNNFLIITDKKTLFRRNTIMYIYNFSEILFPHLHIESVEKMFDEAKTSRTILNHFFKRIKDNTDYLHYIL
jgi:hypothetical protein